MTTIQECSQLSNSEVRVQLFEEVASERRATARIIALLAVFDERRLYLDDGFNSLYAFCVGALRLSESAAYSRIHAARAARKWPQILEGLADASLTLTAVDLIAPHLTSENGATLIDQARHKRKAQVERLIACWHPQPDAPAIIRPLSADRYRFQITIDQEAHDTLRQAQDLMRHSLPDGNPAIIVSRALKLLVADLLRKKAAVGARPRRSQGVAYGSRDIPSAVMRQVWERDEGRCAHLGPNGRCGATGFVEFHHVIPFALGGQATVENIELRCKAHNQHQARLDGLAKTATRRRSSE